ncbi:MAG: hypothetical protein M2R45_00133 [Verrucomicrobia subdivision 3 bacterium]|nr:hypothetical protein [Limisphaerales bacterium]MCS1412407.1 hypothetical protein [Limisphaerales bacterium]
MECLHLFVADILNSRLRYRESKEDMAQGIFTRVFTKINQYSGKVPFHHGVSRMAVEYLRTLAIVHDRAESSRLPIWLMARPELSKVSNQPRAKPNPSDWIATWELVGRLLDSLQPDDRLVINLVYLKGHTHQQISELTDWSVSLAKVRAFRARQNSGKRSLD